MTLKFKHLMLFIFIVVPFHEVFSQKKNQLAVHGSYTFETYDGQKNIAVYMSFFNNSDQDVLIDSFSSDLSSRIEMHDIQFKNDIAKMVMIKEVVIKGKK